MSRRHVDDPDWCPALSAIRGSDNEPLTKGEMRLMIRLGAHHAYKLHDVHQALFDSDNGLVSIKSAIWKMGTWIMGVVVGAMAVLTFLNGMNWWPFL